MSPQTSDRIEKILFDVDDYVVKDKLILSLNNTEQLANVKKSEAVIKEAKALNLKARQEFARIKTLYEKKLVSKSSMDEAERNYMLLMADWMWLKPD